MKTDTQGKWLRTLEAEMKVLQLQAKGSARVPATTELRKRPERIPSGFPRECAPAITLVQTSGPQN